jgi:hypothetical protein
MTGERVFLEIASNGKYLLCSSVFKFASLLGSSCLVLLTDDSIPTIIFRLTNLIMCEAKFVCSVVLNLATHN